MGVQTWHYSIWNWLQMAARETGIGAVETFMHAGKLLALDLLVKVLQHQGHTWSHVRQEVRLTDWQTKGKSSYRITLPSANPLLLYLDFLWFICIFCFCNENVLSTFLSNSFFQTKYAFYFCSNSFCRLSKSVKTADTCKGKFWLQRKRMSHLCGDAPSVSYSAYTTPHGQLQYAMVMLSYQVETDCMQDGCLSSVCLKTKNARLAEPTCSLSGRFLNCLTCCIARNCSLHSRQPSRFLFALLHDSASKKLCPPSYSLLAM